jgi:simple sugar transport system substrate-binding protein
MSSGVSGRRRFLGTVSKAVAGGLLGGLIIGGAAGSLGTYLSLGTSRSTVTTTAVQSKKIKAGYIYIGPAKDFGWSYSHDQGRQWADKQMRGLVESYYVEGVLDPDAKGAMKSLLESRGVDLVVGTSFGYMDPMAELAAEFPDRYFVHINGFRAGVLGNAPENMSVADINTYQIFYLEGLAAGSVTETGSVGVVATFPVPVINRLG